MVTARMPTLARSQLDVQVTREIIRHRLRRLDEQVEDDLLELDDVSEDTRRARVQRDVQLNPPALEVLAPRAMTSFMTSPTSTRCRSLCSFLKSTRQPPDDLGGPLRVHRDVTQHF